jgi:hypothetical protein
MSIEKDNSEVVRSASYLYRWDIHERLTAMEHTSEVRVYSKEEIAEYVSETLTIMEKHNEK